MRSGSPLKVAVVGLGWWGRIITGLLQKNSKLSVVQVVDVDPAAENFAAGLGLAFSNEFEKTIRSPDVQAVILCTPQHGGTSNLVPIQVQNG